MFQRLAGDAEIFFAVDEAGFDRVYFERVGECGARDSAAHAHVLFETVRAVEMYLLRLSRKPAGGEQPHQAEEMIAVQVCDEDAADLADLERRALQLLLRALAAIEQPHFAALRQPERHARNIARPRRHARTRP